METCPHPRLPTLNLTQNLSTPSRVSAGLGSLNALIIERYFAALQLKFPTVMVVICPTSDATEQVSRDLQCLAEAFDDQHLNILCLPTWELSPYEPVALSLKTRVQRIRVLSALAQNANPTILVTTLAAASQATLSRKTFLENCVNIHINQKVDSRDALTLRFLESGYLPAELVEDPGHFACRGDIIDVFPVDQPFPLRIGLLDEQIEFIREYDPLSQRTKASSQHQGQDPKLLTVTQWIIPPAREALINSVTYKNVRENIKSAADHQGISRIIRDPILSSLQPSYYPSHSDSWVPFAYPNYGNLWSFLDSWPDSETENNLISHWNVIWNDEFTCLQEWKKFLNEQFELAKQAPQSDIIAPSVEALFVWNQEILSKIQSVTKIYLDKVTISDAHSLFPVATEKGTSLGTTTLDHIRLDASRNNLQSLRARNSLAELESQLRLWLGDGFSILIVASTESQLQRIQYLLEERKLPCKHNAPIDPSYITIKSGRLSEGFFWPSEKLVMITEFELLGSTQGPTRKKYKTSADGDTDPSSSTIKEWADLRSLADLSAGDAVVHLDHGIGRYLGLVRLDLSGAMSDFLQLEYANKDKLYLPIYHLNIIQKYIGSHIEARLDRLGSQQFSKTKDTVRQSVKQLAVDLVQLYAQRKVAQGIQFSPRDAASSEFDAKFPFEETVDQLKAVDAIFADMESGRIMDRVICGDVGYGKTEVAMRAAFKAVSDGKQVAVLVPTTILALQHEQSFKSRFIDYPILIESISRLKSTKAQQAILSALKGGKIDIIIGTHRLLSKNVEFHDLGLIIIDEEHRFGVEHKERLKTLKLNTHVLTLTATPIPRTLHMALSGLRDISLITTPPIDRLPIKTFVAKYENNLIKRAIEFELSRGGQVFFVHNRIQNIHKVAQTLHELVPNAKIGVAHGQMNEGELEEMMLDFYKKRTKILVCTTIIESGLDLPSANTIIIQRADTYGLAQLYQIRGRVGRGQQRAYAYLLIPEENTITDDAKQRLDIIQRFIDLGSGFNIANHDLEIRGGGNLLGPQQSGQISSVGFDLYTELLEEAVREIQGKQLPPTRYDKEPEIKVPFPAYLSESYIPDVHQRLSLYRRASAVENDNDIRGLEEEMQDRFGALPQESQNLLWLIRIKILLKKIGIETLIVGPSKISILPSSRSQIEPRRAIELVSQFPDQYQLTPDSRFIVQLKPSSMMDLYFSLDKFFLNF
jgi:transcription-repair coupling factor (superfamily II helicase)